MSEQLASVPFPTEREVVLPHRQRRLQGFNLESLGAMFFLIVFTIYFLVPFFWLVVSSTKSAGDLFNTFGLWFAPNFNFGATCNSCSPTMTRSTCAGWATPFSTRASARYWAPC
jgi:multiple sugar transport system permease protein